MKDGSQATWTTLVLLVALSVLPLHTTGQPTSPPNGEGVRASQYVSQQWTVVDGLPVNAVNDIAQTDDRYLWIATFDGLVRFDGARFTTYQSGDHEGLPSSRIQDVETIGNVVWLLTESQHLVRMERGTFQTVALPNVLELYVSDNQTVWAGTGDGLFRVEHGGVAHPVQEHYIQGEVSTVHQTSEGDLWIGTLKRGVYRYAQNGALNRFTGEGRLVNTRINSIASRRDGTVLIAAWNEVWRWADGDIDAVLTAQNEDIGTSYLIQQDHAGNHWVSAEQSVYRYEEGVLIRVADYESRSHTQQPESIIQPDTTAGKQETIWINTVRGVLRDGRSVLSTGAPITQMLQDHAGNLWVTTNGAGIYQLRRSQITVYGAEEGIGSGNIYPILQRHDESIWLGSLGGGLTRITSEDTTTSIPQQGSAPLSNIWALHETPDSTLWVGGSELCRWAAEQCMPYETGSPPSFERVLAIHEDASESLWVGATRGLYRRTRSSEEEPPSWTRYTPQNSNLPHRIVRTIRETDEGVLWVGTNGGGLATFEDSTFYPFSKKDGLPSNLVRDIYHDPEGVTWVATEDRGLVRIERPSQASSGQAWRKAEVAALTTEHGLIANGIHRIIEDEAGRMWMSTNQGIFWTYRSELNAVALGQQERVTTVGYTERDGMRNREANGGMQPAGMRDTQGRIWFPTQAGAVVIDASEVHPLRVSPPVHIERVVTSDSTYRPVNGRVELASDDYNFDVVYTAVNFSDPEGMQFRHQLQGIDEEQKSGRRKRRATYTSISPGSYTFTVQASNGDGVWNEESATLTIVVPPHFYETWWFRALIALVAIAALGGAYRIRTTTLKKRKAELEHTVQVRTEALRHEKQKAKEALDLAEEQTKRLERVDSAKSRFFARISHEFRTPLTLTLGPIDNVLDADPAALGPDEHKQLHMARRNATRLTRMVDQLHDLAQLETGIMAIEPETRDIVAFVSECIWTFQGLAERRNIKLAFDANTESQVVAFDPSKIEKVIASLITNAFQATSSGGSIQVVLQTQHTSQMSPQDASAEGTVLIVEDTGTGMPPEQFQYLRALFQKDDSDGWCHNDQFIGIGLNLVNELVALHGGTIHLQSREGAGTTFTVYLPEQDLADTTRDETVSDDAPALINSDRALQLAEQVLGLEGEQPHPDEQPQGEDDKTTVLIIDDNADFRAYLRWHLEPAYRVIEAKDGTKGYQKARSLLPDIVIADIMMPEMDGLALCESIKTHPDINQIPVIFLTAVNDSETRVQGYEVGGDAYLTKPFSAEELKALVNSLVGARQALREDVDEAIDNDEPNKSSSRLQMLPFDEQLENVINARLSDPEFGVAELAEAMALSTSQLRRKVNTYYDRTPVQLIRYRRLESGAALLHDRPDATVGEVAYAAGFNSQSYFSRAFKEAFGASPSAYRKQQVRSDEHSG